jgi:hypothetical protein
MMSPAILVGEAGTRPSENCGQAKANVRSQGKRIGKYLITYER